MGNISCWLLDRVSDKLRSAYTLTSPDPTVCVYTRKLEFIFLVMSDCSFINVSLLFFLLKFESLSCFHGFSVSVFA